MLAKSRATGTVASTIAETALAEAEQTFASIDRQLASLEAERDGIAISLSLLGSEDRYSDRCAWARERARDFLESTQRRPDKAASRVRDIDDQLTDLAAAHREAREVLQHWRSKRTSELAISLQPKQRAAVVRIAAALSELSAAVSECREGNRQLARCAPLPTSLYLPDVGGELSFFADLSDHRSVAGNWIKRVQQLGILPK